MNRLILVCLTVAILAMIIACGGGGNSTSTTRRIVPDEEQVSPDPDVLTENLKSAVALSAKELASKYKDQAKADFALKEKWLVVGGIVDEVMLKQDQFVTFKPDGGSFYVQCFFDKSWDEKIASLAVGKSAKICGRCSGRTGGNIVLKGCFFPEDLPRLVEAKKKLESEQAAKEEEDRKKREAKEELGRANEKKGEAWVMAQEFITKCVKSPSTASFGGAFTSQRADECVLSWKDIEVAKTDGTIGKLKLALGDNADMAQLEENQYLVSGWVDSQNGFGATVRANFLIKLEYKKDQEAWKAIGEPYLKPR